MTLLQNLANGVRAQFPSTPAPTNATLTKSQAMPGTGSANANAQNTVNTLFGNKATTPTQQTAPTQQPPAGFNPVTTGGDISKAPAPVSSNSGSIVDYLNSKGQASDYGSRSGLATKYGIQGYTGSAEQNTALLNALRNGAPQSSQTTSNIQNTQSSTPTTTHASQSNSTPSTTTPAVTYTPPQTQTTPSTQPPQNQPQGNVGQAGQTMQPQDMTYGGLIQESLRKQNETADKIKAYQEALAKETGAIADEPISLEFKTGHTRNAQLMEAAKEQALQTQLANQAAIYGKAISATAPVQGATFFRDPVTGNLITGNGSIADAAGISGQMAIGAKLPEMQVNVNNANNVKSVLQNLVSTTNVNPSDFNDINKLAAFWGGKTGDPKYAQLSNLANQFATSIAAVMGVSPETIITNAQAKGPNILQTMNDLYNQAMQTYNTARNVANNGAGGASSINDPLGIL